jgi:undecaprenyl-diphosphatase
VIEYIVLGILQGIFEWLPVSSDGVLVLAQVNLFNSALSLQELLRVALLLHLGTFLSALVYFWSDVVRLTKTLFSYRQAVPETQSVLKFLIISTFVSGVLGYLIYVILGRAEQLVLTGAVITGAVGLLLIVTGVIQLRTKKDGLRDSSAVTNRESVLLGVSQGLSVLPGLSRSGLTVSVLLLRKFKEEDALKLSFLMSLPIVLFGNIALNAGDLIFSLRGLVGILFAFLFGLLTIHSLFVLARKVNFGWFVIVFGVLMIVAAFL